MSWNSPQSSWVGAGGKCGAHINASGIGLIMCGVTCFPCVSM